MTLALYVVVVSGGCVQRFAVRPGGHRGVSQSSSPQRKPPPGGVCQCLQLPPLVIHALVSPLGTWTIQNTFIVVCFKNGLVDNNKHKHLKMDKGPQVFTFPTEVAEISN